MTSSLEPGSERPPWSDLTAGNKALAIALWARSLFMITKGLWFVYKFVIVGFLYQRTYRQWLQFEVVFFLISALKILLLMPDVFFYEINWLFYGLALNSALAYSLSFELRMRTKTVLGSKNSKPLKCWYAARMGFLIFIMVTPFLNFMAYEKTAT